MHTSVLCVLNLLTGAGKSMQQTEEHLICLNNSLTEPKLFTDITDQSHLVGLGTNTRCYTACGNKKSKPSEEQRYNSDLKPDVCTVMSFL